MSIIQPVILAGGTGSRLWPLSRELYPKQLLSLVGDRSLLQATLERVLKLDNILAPILVVGEDHRFISKNQITELSNREEIVIILEPVGRNTAPAVCAAAYYVEEKIDDQDVIMLVLPADHLIRKQERIAEAVMESVLLAENQKLVTFGITPQAPETGYGYIQKGDGNTVVSFVEKPDRSRAIEYLESGNYFWNSGMFAFSSDTWS